MKELRPVDLNFICSRIPKDIRKALKDSPGSLILGGGFIRATLAGERVTDIDLFGPTIDLVNVVALNLCAERRGKVHRSDNAITVLAPPRIPVQFITRWTFNDPFTLINSFDFTICQAAVWIDHDGELYKFHSVVSDDFYQDLAARRLVYTFPERVEDAGGSFLRVIKFVKKGYNVQPPSLAGVTARLAGAVNGFDNMSEKGRAVIISGLLRNVDPLTVVDGVDFVDEHEIFTQEGGKAVENNQSES